MNINKRQVLIKAFIISQFSYCPLLWIIHGRAMNKRINTLHEKAMRLVYTNRPNLSFDDLLKEDKSVKINQQNWQILAAEIYKVKNISFHFLEKPYNLRNNSIIQLVSFNGVLKDETLNPPSCHFIIFF